MNTRQQIVRSVLIENANKKFTWGQLDCVLFANSAVTALTGKDHSAPFSYESEAEAAEILQQHGGLSGLFTHVFGEPAEFNELEDGDPVLVDFPVVGELMGMMVSGSAMVKTEGGTISVSAKRIKEGWHVCHKQ